MDSVMANIKASGRSWNAASGPHEPGKTSELDPSPAAFTQSLCSCKDCKDGSKLFNRFSTFTQSSTFPDISSAMPLSDVPTVSMIQAFQQGTQSVYFFTYLMNFYPCTMMLADLLIKALVSILITT
eukprot:m.179901 g.179901  ORF g.179901 m.179901 type:complete len:126 (+) comp15485_c0_seq1:1528-1905(+)